MEDSTLLYRQINPLFVQNGNISSQAFRPTTKDNNKLSVYDGSLISSKNAYEHFTGILGCSSIGVMAVSVRECLDENYLS
jgi:hypothetical protein